MVGQYCMYGAYCKKCKQSFQLLCIRKVFIVFLLQELSAWQLRCTFPLCERFQGQKKQGHSAAPIFVLCSIHIWWILILVDRMQLSLFLEEIFAYPSPFFHICLFVATTKNENKEILFPELSSWLRWIVDMSVNRICCKKISDELITSIFFSR